MGITRSPLPQNNGNLPLTFFGYLHIFSSFLKLLDLFKIIESIIYFLGVIKFFCLQSLIRWSIQR